MAKKRSDLNSARSPTLLFLFCFFFFVDSALQRQARMNLWKEETSSGYEILVQFFAEA